MRHEDKDLQQGKRESLEDSWVGDFYIAIVDLKAFVKRNDLRARAGLDDRFIKMLKQCVVEFSQISHRAVVLFHEFFHAEGRLVIFIPEQIRQLPLHVEQEPVLCPTAQGVQAVTKFPQKLLTFINHGFFGGFEETQFG